jgi:hypothetical protein
MATFLMVLGAMAVVGLVAMALNSQAQATKQAAQAATVAAAGQATTSAAMSIIVFLLAVIVVLLIGGGLAVVGFLWFQNHQKNQRMQALLERVQYYRLMGGAAPMAAHRYARPGLSAAQPGGNILVFGGGAGGYPQGYPPGVPAFTQEDLALLMEHAQGQPDQWADLLPPEDPWRVAG